MKMCQPTEIESMWSFAQQTPNRTLQVRSNYVARWYDPAIGRFIQADSVVPNPASAVGFDRYAYTLNNPVKYTDPSGHASIIEGCKFLGQCTDTGTGGNSGTGGSVGSQSNNKKPIKKPKNNNEGISVVKDDNSNSSVVKILDAVGMSVDVASFGISFAGDVIMAGGYVLGDLAIPELPILDGYIGTQLVDVAYEAVLNPWENLLGGISFALTATGEFIDGSNTVEWNPDQGVLLSIDLGPDTTHDFINQALGATPIDSIGRSAITDTALNLEALYYDYQRIHDDSPFYGTITTHLDIYINGQFNLIGTHHAP